jgi:AcrR family transcriptional regulator
MGRPRIHGDEARSALLAAAERIADSEGVDAISLRRLAAETGLATRATYSTFGSKARLLDALGVSAFNWLGARVAELPDTDNATVDIVEAGLQFRRLAVERTAIYEVAFIRGWNADSDPQLPAASERALEPLMRKFLRIVPAERFWDAFLGFHAICEGLAAIELGRGFPCDADPITAWTTALMTHLAGIVATVQA